MKKWASIIIIIILLSTALLTSCQKQKSTYQDQQLALSGDTSGSEKKINIKLLDSIKNDKNKEIRHNRYGGKITTTLMEYECNMLDAVNTNDFTLVEGYIIKDSTLYKSQQALISDLFNNGIKEYLKDYNVVYYYSDFETGKTFKLYVHESIDISYPDKGIITSEFDWVYTIKAEENFVGLYSVEKWNRSFPTSFMPHAVRPGSKTVYIYEVYNNQKSKTLSSIVYAYIPEARDNNHFDAIRLASNDNYSNDDTYLEMEKGLYMYGLQSNMYLELKYPIKLNEEWEDKHYSKGAGAGINNSYSINKYKIVSILDTLDTPAGTFKNVVVVKNMDIYVYIDDDNQFYVNDYKYFAENNGLVKVEREDRSGNRTVTLLLKEIIN